ncbi:MAG: thiosulfate oxidation carrier protein SoxY [Hyphomicrobiales bacterium]|nr:thiosulfate oxidation carrier protein SoxY [Hyphomicrobiales bacterium]MBV8826559.1 thiosulfate oxidation carrier protein SoxY [Hyphomicrobiales bacterium]MBV9430048.1 thiosulfate oxidation carrier protein SoxY [Bradyrhizobiaceae bacterium]
MGALSRRAALALGLGTAAALAADPARATPGEADEAIGKFTGGKAAEPGPITIDLPEIAENGTAVPLTVTVESPMTASDRITDVLVVADGNPNPRVATFRFTPMSGRAEVATRIRLNATENVIVVARTGDGRFFTARKEVKVTIGGCGG